ncbi:beta-galactosidase trimerization domain-containing protein, partial [Streptomyces sp. NPDC001675]
SGVVDAHDRVHLGGYPGALREVLGLRIDEYLPLRPGDTVSLSDGSTAVQWAERVEPRGCAPVLRFADGSDGGPAAGGAALTRHTYGAGTSWYVATRASGATLQELVRRLGEEAGLRPVADVPDGVEAVRRSSTDGSYLFLINHGEDPAKVLVEGARLLDAAGDGCFTEIPAGGVAVLRESSVEPRS